MLRSRLVTVLVCAVGLAAVAAVSGEVRGADRVVLDRVVAVVNDDIVLESELDKFMVSDPEVQQAMAQLGKAGAQQVEAKLLELRPAALDRLVGHKLVLGEAPRLEVTVDDKQVDRYINQILSTTQMTSVDELRKAVEESGQYGSWAEYLDVLREQMLAFQVRSILAPVNVTEAQVRARYRELAAGEEAEADVVRMDFRPVDDRAKSRDEAYAAAKKVARRLSSGEAVDKVAGEYGLPSAVETLKRGQIAQVFREPVFTARTGAVVGPLEAGQGYTVFKIVEMRASDLRGYEEAKDELRETLSFEAEAKAFAALDEDLRARAHVEIRL